MTPTDSQLVAAAGHDPTAFRQLVDRYAQALDGFFVRRTGDRDAALDLTAETFAQAWAHRHDVDNRRDGSCGPWLFGIARNLLLRSARDRRLASEASERLLMRAGRSTVTPGPDWVEGLDVDIAGAVVVLGAGAAAAVTLLTPHDVAVGLPAGSVVFAGVTPTCTTAGTAGDTMNCTVDGGIKDTSVTDWTGTIETFTSPDSTVGGACRSGDTHGTKWICYTGQKAVDEKLIGPAMLGLHVHGPAAG